MKDVTQPKPEKRKLKKEDIIGLIFGISLAWAIGLGGFIPYILGTVFGVWFTGKMLNSKKRYLKVIFWILFVAVFLLGSLIHGERTTKNIFRNTENKPTTLYADQVTIPGFTKYTDTDRESGFEFSILFPTNSPETYDVDLKEVYVKSYQAHHILNLEEKKFAQYNINISVPQEGKILSEEAINAYLTNYPEGKIAPLNGVLIKKEITTFKGLMAVEYVFNTEMYETKMVHKGIAFVVDGIPIDLSVVYTNLTPESNVYYDGYIRSFAISHD